jgi:hypothetical protein
LADFSFGSRGVADPGCLSRIPDPDFYPSWIPGEKKNCCHTLFCSHKFHKTENYFMFELLKKKIWANFQRIIEIFMQKIVIKLSSRIRDPGSEIRKKPIPDPQHWVAEL